MTRLLLGIAVALLTSLPAQAQAPAPAPAARETFEIAGIQPSARPNPGMRGGILRGNRYELRNATMVDLIRTAANVQPERISGGPSWLEWTRWDIAALAPEGTPPARLQEMLKTLLADRSEARRPAGHGHHHGHRAESERHPQVASGVRGRRLPGADDAGGEQGAVADGHL